ncbi:restriction endonuclease subunit S [Microbispora siamensis]
MRESIVGSVPGDWEVTSLGEICLRGGGSIQTGPFGSQLHASDYVIEGIPSIMPQNIGDNVICEEGVARIAEKDAKRLSRYLLQPGDIVYSRRGDVERRALVRREQAGWLCGTGCLRIRPGSFVDPRFLSYYLGHPEIRAWITRHAIGATMPNLNTQILGDVPVVVPPRVIQNAIGEVLGALDDKIAVNGRIMASANKLATAYWEDAVDSGGRWERFPLGEIAKWISGGTPRTSEPAYWGGDIPWISAASLKSPWIDDSERKITELGAQSGTRLVPAGTVIFVVRGMSLKTEFRIGIAQREVAFGQDCKALVARDYLDPVVLFFAIRAQSKEVLSLVDEAGHGTGRLSTDRLARLSIPVPPDSARRSIETKLGKLAALAAARQRENRTLAEIKDALLPKLVSGQIRVNDVEGPVEGAA